MPMPLSAAQKENLLAAEEKAKQLFLEIEDRDWIEDRYFRNRPKQQDL